MSSYIRCHRKHWKRHLFLILASLLLVFLVVSGCGRKEEQAAKEPEKPAEKVLRVGVLGPFTGPCSRTGEEFRGAATMAFEEIGHKIGDYRVEVVWIDDQSDPEKATRAYEEAVLRDKIDAGILNWNSSVSVACMEVVAKHQVPHFFGFGATEVVNEKYASDPEKYSYWMGKTWPSPSKLSVAYVIALQDAIEDGIWQPREKRAAIYGEDTDWGRSFGKALGRQLKDAGWEVVTDEYFALGETEFYPLLTKLRDLKVAVIGGTVTSAPSYAAFIKQAREVGLKSLIIADGLGWVGEWYEMCGDASDYVLDQIPQWATDEAKTFKDNFEKKWGITPSPSAAGQAYDMTKFFIKVCRRALDGYGEITRETLYKVGREELFTGKLTYTEGLIHKEYKYTPETRPDPVVGQGYFIFPVIQYYGGEGKIIWPSEWKEADIVIPDYMKQ